MKVEPSGFNLRNAELYERTEGTAPVKRKTVFIWACKDLHIHVTEELTKATARRKKRNVAKVIADYEERAAKELLYVPPAKVKPAEAEGWPRYIKMGSTVLSLHANAPAPEGMRTYWKAAGQWGIAVTKELKTHAEHSILKHLDDIQCVSGTYEEWLEDNKGYA